MPTARRALLFALCLLSLPVRAQPFRELVPGLDLAELAMPQQAGVGDSVVTVVRIDPARHPVRLVGGGPWKSARAWAEAQGFALVVNAGMFHPNGKPVGYARAGATLLNGVHSREHMALAVGPTSLDLPAATLLDEACDDRPALEPRFTGILEGIRMIDCRGAVRWAAQARRWSAVVVGLDARGRLLFIHCRSPYPMRLFATLLQRLPLGLVRLQYLEGGPEASLYLRAGGVTRELVGSYETGFNESDANVRAWPLPNVLGVE